MSGTKQRLKYFESVQAYIHSIDPNLVEIGEEMGVGALEETAPGDVVRVRYRPLEEPVLLGV